MPQTHDDMLAEEQIRDVQRRYCRGIDRLEFDLVRNCFHPDAVLEYGEFKGAPDAFVSMAEDVLDTYSSTMHFIGNQLVEVNGEGAWAEHYVVAYHRCPARGGVPEFDFICNFRYADQMGRRGGQWRISRRILLVDSWRNVPLPELGPGPTMTPGTRDRSDPSYALR